MRHKTDIYDGEHQAIVDADVWQRVQVTLGRNGRTGGLAVRNIFGALLKGILRCVPCDCAMTPSHATKDRTNRYRCPPCSTASSSCLATKTGLLLEDVIAGHLGDLFGGFRVLSHTVFRVTRNTDFTIDEDEAEACCRRSKRRCASAFAARRCGCRSRPTRTNGSFNG